MLKRICVFCKKNIIRPIGLDNYNWKKRKVCNKKCLYGLVSIVQKGRNQTSEVRRKHSEAAKKAGCGKWMLGRKHSEETKKKMSGKTPWNYKGLRSIDYLERRKFQRYIQKKVFKRDDYTCQLCGERGGDLQVDHIQSWAEYVELRFCIDNCRTLCTKCHYKVTFGKPMPPTVRAWGHNMLQGGTKK